MTSRLRLQNTMALRTSSRSISARRALGLSRGDTVTTNWATVSAVVAGRATSITLGSRRNWSVSRLTGGGMVAEKNSVW